MASGYTRPPKPRSFRTASSRHSTRGPTRGFSSSSRGRRRSSPRGNSSITSSRFKGQTFAPSFAFNGLVELLAIDDTTLLALERGFVASQEKPGENRCTIRLFSVTLSGATDVSTLESLKGHPEIVPLKKTLVLDLSQVQGLSPELAPSLENFEGMTFGPRLPDGRASLVLVSDDNFSAVQRTWFLLFAIQ